VCTSVGAIQGRDDRKGSGVKNRCDELQKLENQLGRAIMGNFRITNLGVMMAESGFAPSREPTEQQKPTPRAGADVVETKPSPYQATILRTGREIFLPEDGPTELGANVSIADAEWAEQEARRANSQPGLVLWTDGSRDENRAVGYTVVWKKGRSWAGRKAHMGSFQEDTTRSAPPLRAP